MTSFQFLPKTPHPAGVRILFRRNSQHCFEGALQMKRALPKFRAQARQRDWLIEMLLNIAGHRLDQLLSRISDYGFWTATQAFAETGTFCLCRATKERYILASGPFRGAGRPAIHACRGHREYELSVTRPIACEHCMPARVFYYRRHLCSFQID